MIYLVIGPSCSGKTQFVTNSFMKGNCICYKDLVRVTKSDNAYLIGDYTSDKKVRGTDRIARQQLKLIVPQIIKLFELNDGLDVVAEGVNICWSFVFEDLLPYREFVKFMYLRTSKEISLQRNHIIKSSASDAWFKSIWTRTNNIFNKYCVYYDSYVFDTSDNIDFSKISIDNIIFEKYVNAEQKKLF